MAAFVLCLALLSLYLPGMPASLGAAPWVMFGLWRTLGMVFLFRIPGGIRPGTAAEEDLLERLAVRRRR